MTSRSLGARCRVLLAIAGQTGAAELACRVEEGNHLARVRAHPSCKRRVRRGATPRAKLAHVWAQLRPHARVAQVEEQRLSASMPALAGTPIAAGAGAVAMLLLLLSCCSHALASPSTTYLPSFLPPLLPVLLLLPLQQPLPSVSPPVALPPPALPLPALPLSSPFSAPPGTSAGASTLAPRHLAGPVQALERVAELLISSAYMAS